MAFTRKIWTGCSEKFRISTCPYDGSQESHYMRSLESLDVAWSLLTTVNLVIIFELRSNGKLMTSFFRCCCLYIVHTGTCKILSFAVKRHKSCYGNYRSKLNCHSGWSLAETTSPSTFVSLTTQDLRQTVWRHDIRTSEWAHGSLRPEASCEVVCQKTNVSIILIECWCSWRGIEATVTLASPDTSCTVVKHCC